MRRCAELDAGMTYEGYEHLERSLARGNGTIVVLPHLGGWEWTGFWFTRVVGVPITAVVERLEPLIDADLAFEYVPAPYSIIRGARKLDASQCLSLDVGAAAAGPAARPLRSARGDVACGSATSGSAPTRATGAPTSRPSCWPSPRAWLRPWATRVPSPPPMPRARPSPAPMRERSRSIVRARAA